MQTSQCHTHSPVAMDKFVASVVIETRGLGVLRLHDWSLCFVSTRHSWRESLVRQRFAVHGYCVTKSNSKELSCQVPVLQQKSSLQRFSSLNYILAHIKVTKAFYCFQSFEVKTMGLYLNQHKCEILDRTNRVSVAYGLERWGLRTKLCQRDPRLHASYFNFILYHLIL